MLDRLKSLPLTIILTVLIWMYAEAQFTAVQPDVKISIRVLSPSPEFDLQVYDGHAWTGPMMNLVVTLQGPRDQIERISKEANEISTDYEPFAGLTYVPSGNEWARAVAPGSSGLMTVNTAAVLNRFDYFRSKGVTVTHASPQRVQIKLDPVVKLQKRVEFRSPLVDQFSLSPDQVDIRIPSAALASLGGADQLKVVAEVADSTHGLDTLTPDATHQVPVRFVVEYKGARNEGITVKPKEGILDAHIVRRQQSAFQVPDIPVWLSGPPALLARYDIDIQPKSVPVTVSGTANAIEALRNRMDAGGSRAAGIYAYLDITADDAPAAAPARRRVRFVLPEGLSQLSLSGEVAYRLVERAPTTTPSTGSASNR